MNGCWSLLTDAAKWLEPALTRAIDAAVCAAPIAIVALALNVLFRRWLSARQVGLLWGLVLVRLLVPAAPSSPFSLQNAPKWLPSAHAEAAETDDMNSQLLAETSVVESHPYQSAPETGGETTLAYRAAEQVVSLLPLIWLLVGGGSLLMTLLAHGRFCARLRRASACDDRRLGGLWDASRKRAGVRRQIPIVLFDGVGQPAILGLFRPKLLLPTTATELEDRQLEMVMLHELAHVRRWHVAVNWLLVVLRVLHWWNPIYWLAAGRFQSLREQSCDAFAVSRIEGQPTRDYSELLLILAQRSQSVSRWRVMLPASMLGFLSSLFRKRAIRNRLKALRSANRSRGRWHAAAFAAIVGVIGGAGFTDASVPETPNQEEFPWIIRAAVQSDWNVEPSVIRTYDVTKALERIVAVDPYSRPNMEMSWSVVGLLKGSTGRFEELANDRQWDKDHVTLAGNTLTIKAPLKVHAEFARNLAAWEQSGLGQITIATRIIADDRDIASAIGVSWRYLEAFADDQEMERPADPSAGMPVVRANASVDDYLPIVTAVLNLRQVTALARAAQSGKGTNSYAPKVTLFNGQRFRVFNGTQRPFVIGIEGASGGERRPKIATIDEGVKTTWRAIASRDLRKVQLEGGIELSEVDDVRTASTVLRGQTTTIQIPRVKRRRIDVASEVEDGQSLLVGCIPAYEQTQFLYLLVTPRYIVMPVETK